MNRESTRVKVYRPDTKLHVEGLILDGLSDQNLADYSGKWKPAFDAYAAASPTGTQAEDSQWDWGRKAKDTVGMLTYQSFALEIDGSTEGLMLIDKAQHFSRIEAGKPLVYVEYLSVAPWNRPTPGSQPRYKLVGSLLMAQAIEESRVNGFKGRIGLHSLPGARSWYLKLNFTDLGNDPDDEGLSYFELTSANAEQLLPINNPRI